MTHSAARWRAHLAITPAGGECPQCGSQWGLEPLIYDPLRHPEHLPDIRRALGMSESTTLDMSGVLGVPYTEGGS